MIAQTIREIGGNYSEEQERNLNKPFLFTKYGFIALKVPYNL